MSHLLKLTEWQGSSGKWYAADVSDLAHGSGCWWHVPRMLNIELTDYVLLLKDKYHATNIKYDIESNMLFWDWTYQDCHKFLLFINREAIKRKFFI